MPARSQQVPIPANPMFWTCLVRLHPSAGQLCRWHGPLFCACQLGSAGDNHTTGPKRNGSMHQENAAAVWIYIPVIYLHSRGNVQDKMR